MILFQTGYPGDAANLLTTYIQNESILSPMLPDTCVFRFIFISPYNNQIDLHQSNRGKCFLAIMEWEKAEEDLAKVLEMRQNFVEPLVHHVMALKGLNRFQDALR